MNISNTDKFKLWIQEHRHKEKTELAKAIPERKEIGPMDFDFTGMPPYLAPKSVILIGGCFAIFMFFLTQACIDGNIVMEEVLLARLNLLGIVGGGAAIFSGMWIGIDGHRGTFDHFEKIFEPWLRFDTNGGFIEASCRVIDSWEAWPWKHRPEPEEVTEEEIIAEAAA